MRGSHQNEPLRKQSRKRNESSAHLIDIDHCAHRAGKIRRRVLHTEAGKVEDDDLLVQQCPALGRLELFENVEVLERLRVIGWREDGLEDECECVDLIVRATQWICKRSHGGKERVLF